MRRSVKLRTDVRPERTHLIEAPPSRPPLSLSRCETFQRASQAVPAGDLRHALRAVATFRLPSEAFPEAVPSAGGSGASAPRSPESEGEQGAEQKAGKAVKRGSAKEETEARHGELLLLMELLYHVHCALGM